MNRNTLFIISSVIHFSSNPLSYAKIRSRFSNEQRAEQTVKTIESIKTMVPHAKILLIELGTKKELPNNIEGMVDKYLYLGHRKIIRDAADGPYKGLGEALGLYLANKAINSFQADYFFKISGRYFLNENFNEMDWTADAYTSIRRFDGICTTLYGFPARLYQNWRYSLRASIPYLLNNRPLEAAQLRNMEKPIHVLDRLGLSGRASVPGKFVEL